MKRVVMARTKWLKINLCASFIHSLTHLFFPTSLVCIFVLCAKPLRHPWKEMDNPLTEWKRPGLQTVLFPWVQCLARFRCSVNSWWVNKDNRLRGSEGTHCSMGPRQSVRGWAGPETRGISTTRRGLPSAMGTVATDFLHWITELGSSSQRLSEFFTVEPCLESGGISRVAWIIKK